MKAFGLGKVSQQKQEVLCRKLKSSFAEVVGERSR